MSSLMLIGAMLASLALGVLLAYGICQMIFRMFWIHALSTARRGQAASLRANVEG